MRKLLFYRRFIRLTGGALKFWHYFNHARQSPGFSPEIYFSADTVWDDTNPWRGLKEYLASEWNPTQADALFLSGRGWEALTSSQRSRFSKPIINLIQGVRHAHPSDPRYEFLAHRAIRICVSNEVQQALEATGRVNGPLFTIPNAIDTADLPASLPWGNRSTDVLVVAGKRPRLGRVIRELLRPVTPQVARITERLPRAEFLEQIRTAKVAVFLPERTEGCYLPALEAMGLGTVVVCPDCVGNRSFCVPGQNSFRPAYTTREILAAARQALRLTPAERNAMVEAGYTTAKGRSLPGERKAFLDILGRVEELW